MTPVRVLQVLGSLERGGAECRMMDVWRNIDRSCTHFDFLILEEGKQAFESEARSLGAEVVRLNMPRIGTIGHHYRQLRSVVRSGGYNAVHAHTSYHCGLVLLAAKREGVPIRIAHARTVGSKRGGLAKAPMIAMGRTLIRQCATDRLAISRQAGSYLFGNDDFEVLPNAIDVDQYQHTGENESRVFRERLGIPADAFVIAQIGRFNAMKNHEFSIRLFSTYADTHSDAFLVMVGDGPLRAEMEELSASLGLAKRVRFTGIRDDVPSIMGAFDVLLHPSTFEGLGGVVLEAQAAGNPVIASDAVPTDADMGIGLIRRLPLEVDHEAWITALDAVRSLRQVDLTIVRKAFDERGYTLRKEIETLECIYGRA